MPDGLTPDQIESGLALYDALEQGPSAAYGVSWCAWSDHATTWHRAALLQLRAQAAELERLREENDRYETYLYEADAVAYAHFTAVGRPMPRGSNWLEGLWELEPELARLRHELFQATASFDLWSKTDAGQAQKELVYKTLELANANAELKRLRAVAAAAEGLREALEEEVGATRRRAGYRERSLDALAAYDAAKEGKP